MATVSIGADDNTDVSRSLLGELRRRGFTVIAYGPVAGGSEQWGEVGVRVAEDVAAGRADTGIVCCYTGTGVTMAANKVPGVRAALCVDADTSRGARRWNDANVLGLALGRLTVEEARAILDAWLEPAVVDESERPSIELLAEIDRRRRLSG